MDARPNPKQPERASLSWHRWNEPKRPPAAHVERSALVPSADRNDRRGVLKELRELEGQYF